MEKDQKFILVGMFFLSYMQKKAFKTLWLQTNSISIFMSFQIEKIQ